MLFRSPPTYAMRQVRAEVLLHEMAHVVGDLVTMQWWDDLWLNEAFASWAAAWAAQHATEFTSTWASFRPATSSGPTSSDMGPSSHPIRGPVPDVAAALANPGPHHLREGQSVLKQRWPTSARTPSSSGLRAYFRTHAWGNTRLADLMDAVGEAAARDLTAWTADWFDRAGTDTLTLRDGTLEATAPEGEPRSHTLQIGSYATATGGTGPLRLVGSTAVTTSGRSTLVRLPPAELQLINDEDLTFAAARPDPASTRAIVARAGDLPGPMARTVAVSTAYDLMLKGELPAVGFLDCVLGALGTERTPGIVEPLLGPARAAAEQWCPPGQVRAQRDRVADVALAIAASPDLRTAALQTLAGNARTDAHFAALQAPAQESTDLGWRVLERRAELGGYDDSAVRALLARDPDPDAGQRALAVRAACPQADAKQEAWHAVFEERALHAGAAMAMLGRAFWRPGQAEVLGPYPDRYLEELTRFGEGGMLEVMSVVATMYPRQADSGFADRAERAADRLPPYVSTILLRETDLLRRQLRTAGASS
ncbi:MAG: ERAP1-like C-terminal domain-containing protein [Nocardioides sp.]